MTKDLFEEENDKEGRFSEEGIKVFDDEVAAEETPEGKENELFSDDEEEAEAPLLEEGVEIPEYGATSFPMKEKKLLIVSLFVFLVPVVLGIYVFLQSKRILVEEELKLEEEKPSFVTKKIEKMPISDNELEKGAEKKLALDSGAIKGNAAPSIRGNPETGVYEGSSYSFIPTASDVDPADKLIFSIANQPDWTNFDHHTGALTGTPRSEDVGTYENIVIMVTDTTDIASLPGFDITVKGVSPITAKEKKYQQTKIAVEKKIDEKKELRQQHENNKGKAEKEETGQYTLPDLTGLIKQSDFQNAALEYYKKVKKFSQAYTLKLEVNCIEGSVQIAFQQGNFDRRMFILPKDIKGKNCFVVFWGLYTTKKEAMKALSTVPAFFSKPATKPELVLIKQYL